MPVSQKRAVLGPRRTWCGVSRLSEDDNTRVNDGLAREFRTSLHRVVFEFDKRLGYTVVETEVFVALRLARPHLTVMFVYDSNCRFAVANLKRVFDFLSHDALEVRLRIAGDLKEAVDRIGLKLGKPFFQVITEAFRSWQLALFESFIFGIGVIEEFIKTTLREGDIDAS
jgi:hypothetical protein